MLRSSPSSNLNQNCGNIRSKMDMTPIACTPSPRVSSSTEAKGTTIIICWEMNRILCLVDSRASYTREDGSLLVENDGARKYRVFWNKIVVAYLDSVPLGQEVLRELRKKIQDDDLTIDKEKIPDNRLTVEEMAAYIRDLKPKNKGNCDFYVAGLLDDGTPEVFRVTFKDGKEPKKQSVKGKKKFDRIIVEGSGSKSAEDYLGKRKRNLTWDEKKSRLCSAMVLAATTSPCTGGLLNEIHLTLDDCHENKKKTWKYMKDFNSWIKPGLLFLLYDRRSINLKYLEDWIWSRTQLRQQQMFFRLGSPLVKVKHHELFVATITFCTQHVADILLASGIVNNRLVRNLELREFEYDSKTFYLAQPSTDILENLRVENMDEHEIILEEMAEGTSDQDIWVENLEEDEDQLEAQKKDRYLSESASSASSRSSS